MRENGGISILDIKLTANANPYKTYRIYNLENGSTSKILEKNDV